MQIFKIKEHLTEAELEELIRNTEDKKQCRRWQIIYLAKTSKMNAGKIGKVTGVSKSSVHKIVTKYNEGGCEVLNLTRNGGRREECAYMTLEEEQKLLEGITQKASIGLIVVAKQIKLEAEKKLGHEVSKDYAYDLMHRHGWRKVEPRPYHPKRDEEAQAEFKKNFRNSWRKPLKRLSRKTRDL